MSINSLLQLIVERNPETTGYHIAEALWLMLTIKEAGIPTDGKPLQQPPEQPTSKPASASLNAEHQQADLYPLGASDSEATSAQTTPLRISSVGTLPHAASIARALRPLRRRVPSRHRLRLNEKLTAERSAEENTLVPVMLPVPSRWLALHLVVDHGRSSMIWQETIQELHRLLIRQGAFRDVRLWHFNSDTDDNELRLFAGRTSTIPRRARELSDPEGRHLILIVSDGVGRAWHDGRLTTAMSLWSASGPVALCQLMPPQLWNRTALGREIEVRLQAKTAGIPNTQLTALPADDWGDAMPTHNTLLPVVTLTPESIKTWVGLLIGRPESIVGGYALDRVTKPTAPQRPTDVMPSPQQRLQRFLSLSTPTAQRLALLASATPVTLPILHLLCRTFLPMADQSHIAEVLLSGLLYQTSSDAIDPAADAIVYEFHTGVRELLLELAPFKQSSEVIASVSAYLEEHAEHEHDMRVDLALPDHSATRSRISPFAHIRATILRRLGYEHLARMVEQVEARCEENAKSDEHFIEFNQQQVQENAIKNYQLGLVAEEQLYWNQAEIYYQQALAISSEIGDRQIQARTLHQLGILAQKQLQWDQAEIYYQQALAISYEIGDLQSQARILHQLGIVAQKQLQWNQAEIYYQQALAISSEIGDRQSQSHTLHQFGIVAQEQRQWDQAEIYYQQALAISSEIGDRLSQARTLHQLGLMAQEQRQWDQAEIYYQQALAISSEISDLFSQAHTLHQLGLMAQEQRQWNQAEIYYQQALAISSNIGSRLSQARTLHQLGLMAQEQRQWNQAEIYYQQALAISSEIGDRLSQARILHQLGIVAQKQRQWNRAESYYHRVLDICIENNDQYNQAHTFHQLGIVAQEQHHWNQAEHYYQQALAIKIEFNDRYSQASTYHQLGIAAQEQHHWNQAEHYYQQALAIKIEFNDRYSQASTYHNLGTIAQEQRQWNQAQYYYQQALTIKIEFNDRYSQASTYGQLGLLAEAQEQWDKARNYLLQALLIFTEFGDQYNIDFELENLARIKTSSNDPTLIIAMAKVLRVSVEEAEQMLRLAASKSQ
ncbi:TPR domain protein [Oscillochloris trichoides DG-6]|uniref:TPR domain protein n=1 Tax=Oscillochloris trichoides DG-6 TaxID=765420 RepID=E1IEM4_9CHLR|nr:tetratricopeptide repeat protein [Oscillochloris trichoides]EFO80365.1 TPR domain protein [Oscillochloris trichoides DG-6]